MTRALPTRTGAGIDDRSPGDHEEHRRRLPSAMSAQAEVSARPRTQAPSSVGADRSARNQLEQSIPSGPHAGRGVGICSSGALRDAEIRGLSGEEQSRSMPARRLAGLPRAGQRHSSSGRSRAHHASVGLRWRTRSDPHPSGPSNPSLPALKSSGSEDWSHDQSAIRALLPRASRGRRVERRPRFRRERALSLKRAV